VIGNPAWPAAISVVRKDTLVFATDGIRSNFSDRLLSGSLPFTPTAAGLANGQSVLDEDPQHHLRIALAFDQLADLAGSGVGEQERRGFFDDRVHRHILEAVRPRVKA
jgi:hypothetical protein